MARARNAEEARQALLDAAERFVSVRTDAVVIVARGSVEVVRRPAGARPPAPLPGEVSAYDMAVIRSLTDIPTSARRLARVAGHRYNSYFRLRVRLLVDEGRIRRTSRGLRRP